MPGDAGAGAAVEDLDGVGAGEGDEQGPAVRGQRERVGVRTGGGALDRMTDWVAITFAPRRTSSTETESSLVFATNSRVRSFDSCTATGWCPTFT